MNSSPQLKKIIKNDISAFMCTWPPVLFAALSVFLFVKSEVDKHQHSWLEILFTGIIIFTVISLCLWPFILWWWRVIYKTFKNGIEINAISTKMNLNFVLGIGIKYTFDYKGTKIEHIPSLVSNKKTRELANKKFILIIYNPEKNISFIKDAYI